MTDFFSSMNVIAAFAAIGTALMGVITYRRRKEIDLEYKKGELKREAVTEYLSTLDALINHAAHSNGQENYDEASEILRCKKSLNKVYIYAPASVVDGMDKLLTEAIELATIISKIPNSEIFKEEQVARYHPAMDRTHKAYLEAVNIARKAIGLHSDRIGNVQLLVLGSN